MKHLFTTAAVLLLTSAVSAVALSDPEIETETPADACTFEPNSFDVDVDELLIGS